MNIGFRADSSYTIGTGHIHRCLNLAKEFKKKKKNCFFISKTFSGNINELIEKNFYLLSLSFKGLSSNLTKKQITIDANQTIKFIKKFNIDLIFLDQYQLNQNWEKKVNKHCKIVLISDHLDRNSYCDYFINYQVPYESNSQYNKLLNNNCKRLIGSDYSIIKKFLVKKNKKIKKKITVYMGGVDTKNYTTKIISILKKKVFKNYNKLIVIGEKNQNSQLIIEQIKNFGDFVYAIGNRKNLFTFFKGSSLIISNAGTSMYEHLTLGLNSLIVPQSNTQKIICKGLSDLKLINFVKNKSFLNEKIILKILNKEINNQKSETLKILFDSKGARRIVEYFTNKTNFRNAKLQVAEVKDKYFLFKLFNDFTVIKNSLKKKKITFINHEKWFKKKINSNESKIFIFKHNNLNLGQVRLDKIKSSEVVVTYSVSNEFREKGVGYKMLKLLSNKISKGISILAIVKKNNLTSKKIFNKLNYNLKDIDNKKNHLIYQLKN